LRLINLKKENNDTYITIDRILELATAVGATKYLAAIFLVWLKQQFHKYKPKENKSE
jgi:hypothetical protein